MKVNFRNRIFGISLVIIFLTTIGLAPYSFAQKPLDMSNVKFKIVCDDTVRVNQIVHIKFVLDYEDQFIPDSLELKVSDFDTDCAKLISLTKTDTSSSISILNGNKTASHTVKWSALIRPLKEGRFSAPEVKLLYNNAPLNISPGVKTIAIKGDTDAFEPGNNPVKPENTIVRLESVVDKETINLGDSVLLQFKLQSNHDLSGVGLDSPIEIDDCFYENIGSNAVEPVQVNVDGVECNEWILFEYRLIPLKSGIITIPEVKLKGNCMVRKEEPDQFWFSFQNVPFQAKSKEIKLHVK